MDALTFEEKQYERVARFLDGRAIPLDEAEQTLAAQVREDQAALASVLDAALPAEADQRARRRVRAATAGAQRRIVRVGKWVAGAAAVAAMVLLAIHVMLQPGTTPLEVENPGGLAENGELVDPADLEIYIEATDDLELDLIAYELEQLEYQLQDVQPHMATFPLEDLDEGLDGTLEPYYEEEMSGIPGHSDV